MSNLSITNLSVFKKPNVSWITKCKVQMQTLQTYTVNGNDCWSKIPAGIVVSRFELTSLKKAEDININL